MVRINETEKRIVAMMEKAGMNGKEPLDLTKNGEHEEGEGLVLDSGRMSDDGKDWNNFELYAIYPNLTADTNLGLIDLKKEVQDEDDWFTIEDVVKDLIGDIDGSRIVWVVLYTLIEADDFQNPYVTTKVFGTEKDAEKHLAQDYNNTLNELKNGGTAYDIIEADNYGGNAYVKLGERDDENIGNSTIEAKHTWCIYKDNIYNRW